MSYSAAVLADSPIIYWRLGDTSGTTAVDSSGNSHDGTYTGSPVMSVAGALVGDADTCVTFDGTNDKVDITYGAFMDATNITVEAWIKTTATGLRAIWDRDKSLRVWQMLLNSGNLQFTKIGGTGGNVTAATTGLSLNDGNWHHLVATYDGTNIKLYVDGALAQTTAAGALSTAAAAMSVGVNNTSTARFNGQIDEAAYYGTALSAARILVHYQSGFVHGGVAGTLGALTGSMSGTASAPGTDGTLTGTLPVLAGALTVGVEVTGALAGTLPVLSGDAVGAYGPNSDLTGTLPTLSGDFAGTAASPGTSGDLTGALPALTGDLAALILFDATLTGTLPTLTGALTGAAEVTGALAGTLAAMVGTIVADHDSGTSYEDIVLADDPYYYFRLDEPTGSYVNLGSSAVTLTNVGTPTQGADGAFTDSAHAVGVNGTTGYLQASGPSALADAAIEFWYKGTDGEGIIVSGRATASQRSITMGVGTIPFAGGGITGAPYIGAEFSSNWVGIHATAATIHDNQWHHVVGVIDSPANGFQLLASHFKLYVDGVLCDVAADTAGSAITAVLDFNGGSYRYGNSGYATSGGGVTATLDELALYAGSGDVLPADRVLAHYLSGVATMPDRLNAVLPALTGALDAFAEPAGSLTGVLPALVSALVAVMSFPQDTETRDRGNGRTRNGRGTLLVANPVDTTPATIEPVRVMAQSVPEQTMSGGRPV